MRFNTILMLVLLVGGIGLIRSVVPMIRDDDKPADEKPAGPPAA